MLQRIFSAKLDREEAINVLKRMLSTHNGEINYVNIVAPNDTNNTLSEGYQLHVKGASFHSTEELDYRVRKYGLEVKEEGERIIIYKPKKL